MRERKKRIYLRNLWICLMWATVLMIIPFRAAAENSIGANMEGPIFSEPGGFYSNTFELTLSSGSGTQIRYTTDGSEPTDHSALYSQPIKVAAPPLSQSPMTNGVYVGARPVMNGMVIKAAAYAQDGTAVTKTITNTYFVGADAFSVPVMAISIQPEEFAGGSSGMYSNFNDKNITPQCYIEYYNENGEPGFQHSAQIKISGHGSRGGRKKSFRINFPKGKYEGDGSVLSYDLFPDARQNFYSNEKVTKHGKLTARVTDWEDTLVHETFIAAVADPLRPETMTARAVAIFINGEFWGVYETREQVDNNFIAQHYSGIKKSQVVALSFDWDTANYQYSPAEPLYRVSYDEGPDDAETAWYEDYMKMYRAITQKDLSIPSNYEKAGELVDIDNLMDYYLIYMFGDNEDWPGNNYKLWRTVDQKENIYGHDGKWRFIIHDFDTLSFSNAGRDSMWEYTNPKSDTDSRRPAWATDIYRSLFRSEEFRNRFAARYSTYAGTAFSPERTKGILNDLVQERRNDVGRDFYRWGINGGSYDLSTWEWKISGLEYYLDTRLSGMINSIRNYYNSNFGLKASSDAAAVTFSVDPGQGYFDVAGAEIRPDLYDADIASGWTSDYIKGLPIDIEAKELEGYLFRRIEITRDGRTEYVDERHYSLTPAASDRRISVNAVYEKEDIGDKTELGRLMDEIRSMDGSGYTDSSWESLQAALTEAEPVFSNSRATQAEVDEALEKLQTSYDGLRRKGSKTALQALFDADKGREEQNYEKGWSAFVTALEKADRVLADPNALQEEIDEAVSDLQAAVNGLVERPKVNPGETEGPKETEGPNEAEIPAPAKPSSVKAYSAGARAIKISWGKIGEASQYVIYRSEHKNGSYAIAGEVNAGNTTFTDKNLKNGKNYYYKIAAGKVANGKPKYSKLSNPVKCKAALTGPSEVKAKKVNASAAAVSWRKTAGANKYEIYRAVGKKKNYKKIDTVNGKKTTYRDKGLKKGTVYYYKIRAIQKIGKKTYKSKYSKIRHVKMSLPR